MIRSNSFTNNIGMKTHNGGALAVACVLISSTHQDYYSVSSELMTTSINALSYYSDYLDTSLSFEV